MHEYMSYGEYIYKIDIDRNVLRVNRRIHDIYVLVFSPLHFDTPVQLYYSNVDVQLYQESATTIHQMHIHDCCFEF